MNRCTRQGTSIIEIVVVLGIGSAMLGLSVSTLHFLFRAERATQANVRNAQVLSQLSRLFRQDVYAARSVELADPDAGDDHARRSLTLHLPGEQAALWRADRELLHRELRQGNALLHRETFRLPLSARSRFEESGSPAIVSLIVGRPAGRDPRLPEFSGTAPTLRTIRFDAAPGRDRHFERSAP